jgi:hypothetical protein
LEKRGGRVEVVGQYLWLVVEGGAANVIIYFLQTDKIRVFFFDYLENPLHAIAPIATANALVNVVAEQAHTY